MSLTIEELELFVTSLASSPARWAELARHCDDARVYEQIWDDQDVNAWVICWSEDQDTGFHDHDDSAAAIAVISGSVREDRLTLGGGGSGSGGPAGEGGSGWGGPAGEGGSGSGGTRVGGTAGGTEFSSAHGRELGAGAVFSVPPVAIHRVQHAGRGPAVTIHAYSPPLTRTGAYRVGENGELERESLPYEAELRAEAAVS